MEYWVWIIANKWLIVCYICIVHFVYKAFQIQNCSSEKSCKKAGKVPYFTDGIGGTTTSEPLRDLFNVV